MHKRFTEEAEGFLSEAGLLSLMDDMLAGAIMGPLGEAGGPSPGVLAWAQQQQPSAIPAEAWRALGLPDASSLAVRTLNPKEPKIKP